MSYFIKKYLDFQIILIYIISIEFVFRIFVLTSHVILNSLRFRSVLVKLNLFYFQTAQLKSIRSSSLARILCDNGDAITHVQPQVMQRTFREAYPTRRYGLQSSILLFNFLKEKIRNLD
jgi:hypothetical protein